MEREEILKHGTVIAEQVVQLHLKPMHIPRGLTDAAKLAIGVSPEFDVADMEVNERKDYLSVLSTARTLVADIREFCRGVDDAY